MQPFSPNTPVFKWASLFEDLSCRWMFFYCVVYLSHFDKISIHRGIFCSLLFGAQLNSLSASLFCRYIIALVASMWLLRPRRNPLYGIDNKIIITII